MKRMYVYICYIIELYILHITELIYLNIIYALKIIRELYYDFNIDVAFYL